VAFVITIGALVLIAAASSTREGREEARQRLKPYERAAGIAALVLWSLIFLSIWIG
jgi:hypothetical protein